MKFIKSKKAIVLLGVVAAGIAAAVAIAAWTASGSGNGYAQAGHATALSTLSTSAITSGLLYPSGSGDVKVKISNPNPYAVTVTGVTGNGVITSDKGAACDASTGVTFTDQTGLSLVVPANNSAEFTFAGAAQMSNASDNSCQDALFTIPVSLAGASS